MRRKRTRKYVHIPQKLKDDDVEKQMKTFSEFSFKSHDSIFSRV